MWPSPIGLDSQRIRRWALRRGRGGGVLRGGAGGIGRGAGRVVVGEFGEGRVDLPLAPARDRMAAALERDQTGAGNRRDELRGMTVRDDLVLRAVQNQRRDADAGEQVVDVGAIDRAQGFDEDGGGGLPGPADPILAALERGGPREDPTEAAWAP